MHASLHPREDVNRLFVSYSGPFLKWIIEELQQMGQRTRRLIMMHASLHPREDVNRLYVSRKEEESGITSI